MKMALLAKKATKEKVGLEWHAAAFLCLETVTLCLYVLVQL